jgi:hypothetical protein
MQAVENESGTVKEPRTMALECLSCPAWERRFDTR